VKLSYHQYRLQFKHTFHIAAGARNSTEAVFVKLEQDGICGYGEVALPPYLKDNIESVIRFLKKLRLPLNYVASDFFPLLETWNQLPDICYPALAAVDIALHDFHGRLISQSIKDIYNIQPTEIPFTAYTLGISSAEEMQLKITEAKDFEFFKLKLGDKNDEEGVNNFRKFSNKPFCVDANRGWADVEKAGDFCNQLYAYGCAFAEQPFEKDKLAETNQLRKLTSLPIILDESIQVLNDVEKVKDFCDGINIKMAKCGGVYPAYKMIEKARAYGLKVFIGCMSEGSCSCSAAAQLASLADWVDLDGPLLISNDPFEGLIYNKGRIQLSDLPGSGVLLKEDQLFF
jgi:L-Ala-D/L-Glu epimerase